MPIIYMNVQAMVLFAPTYSTDSLSGSENFGDLRKVLKFTTEESFGSFLRSALRIGHVQEHECRVRTFDDKSLPAKLWGNRLTWHESGDCFVFYLMEDNGKKQAGEDSFDSSLASIINAAFLAEDVNDSIQTALALSGNLVGASRSYIFEKVHPGENQNTFEWCAEGVEPAINKLQNLRIDTYFYDLIMSSGMFVINDVNDMPAADRSILAPQGIKSLAIIPFYDNDRHLGYVGFDDCAKNRTWSHSEISFLQSLSLFIVTLLKRRNAEYSLQRSKEILQLVTDTSDDFIYASTLADFSLVFVNRSLAHHLGREPEDLLGQKCWDLFGEKKGKPCSNCPIPNLSLHPGSDRSKTYTWENKHIAPGKTYFAKDVLVRWIDGQPVHIEAATDISSRIKYEEQLRYFAATDGMTQIANRMWGARKLEELRLSGAEGSLCFLDVDGLKKTNDTYGHAVGDKLLNDTVQLIQKHMGEKDFICRWGGDEFLLMLHCNTSKAAELIGKIQGEMDVLAKSTHKPYTLSFSYGIVPFRQVPGTTLDTLTTLADQLMYDNKMAKRGAARRRRRGE